MQPLKEQDLPSPSSSFDFNPENYTHLAWIPCVSGHLDYCLMSTGLCGNFIENKFDKTPVNINYCDGKYSDGHKRKIILKSWVDWRDQLEGDGEFNVVVLAETNNTNDLDARSLSGRICIFPKEYETLVSEEFRKFYLPISSANKIWLRHKKRDKSSQAHLTNYERTVGELNNQYNALQFSFHSPAFGNTATEVYYIDFYLQSNGFVYLKYVDTTLDQIRSIADDDKYVLVRQAFYYLKYSLHKHKHHGEEADALTTVIPYVSDDLKRITGLQIIGQLKRELTRIKRTLSGKSRSCDDGQALGVLGYMRSLLRSSLQSKLIETDIYEREVAWLEGMTQSIRTQGEGAALRKNKFNQSNQNAIQLMIFGLAFISFAVIGWLTLEATAGVGKTYGDAWIGGSSLTRLLFDAQNYLMFIGGLFLLLVCVHRALHTVATLEVRPHFTRRVKRASWLHFTVVAILITLLTGVAFLASIWPWLSSLLFNS